MEFTPPSNVVGLDIDDGLRIIVDPYDKYVKSEDVLTEAGMIGGDPTPRRNIPDYIKKNLIQAIFTREGGWGRPTQTFKLYVFFVELLISFANRVKKR